MKVGTTVDIDGKKLVATKSTDGCNGCYCYGMKDCDILGVPDCFPDVIFVEINRMATHEPAPTGEGKIILDLVQKDLKDRAEVGKKKYGTLLRAHNGRDALVDALQEAYDLVMYLRQTIYERDGK